MLKAWYITITSLYSWRTPFCAISTCRLTRWCAKFCQTFLLYHWRCCRSILLLLLFEVFQNIIIFKIGSLICDVLIIYIFSISKEHFGLPFLGFILLYLPLLFLEFLFSFLLHRFFLFLQLFHFSLLFHHIFSLFLLQSAKLLFLLLEILLALHF